MSRLKFLSLTVLYSILLFGVLIYSFSQVDLNLTISSNFYYQLFQKQLLYLGYFNRPLSTLFYIIIVLFLFIFYLLILRLARLHKITDKQIVYLIIVCIVILFLSYPAFSHDIYNYMFDARMVTKYFSNPYIHKALDFASDPWIRFMHWTHRTYPYGPLWLVITLPFSYLGFGKFVVTLINFKVMFVIFYVGNILLIKKILNKTFSNEKLTGVAFFAFNPVILIESLVSPHNELAMLFFLLLAIYLGILQKKFLWWIISLLLSGGIKFITLIFLPLTIFYNRFTSESKYGFLFKACLALLLPLIILQIYFRAPYPWYCITLLGLGALLTYSEKITTFHLACTFGSLLYYIPYLYVGYYPFYVVQYQLMFFILPIIFVFIWLIIKSVRQKILERRYTTAK